jgi:hypothetical protein
MAGRISYYGNIVKDGLVLFLDAAKRDSYPGVGTVWNDISGFRNNGTLTNGPTFNSLNGGSVVFDGVDDYSTLPNIPIRTNLFTIDIWFKMNGNQSANAALLSVNAAASSNNIQISFINSNEILFFYNGLTFIGFATSFSLDVWYNIMITRDTNNDIKTYVNGSQTNTINYNANYNFTEQLRIGVNRGNDTYFKGNISVTRLYVNKFLSATEVLQNYNATKGRYL